jgi:hypothetical protein
VTLTTLDLVREGYGIKQPSPVQQAICQALDGLPLGSLWEFEDVRTVFGNAQPAPGKPGMVLIVAASRALKTKMVAASALQAVMTCDVGVATAGDEIRLSVLGPDLDKAKVGFSNMLALARKLYDGALADPKVLSFKLNRADANEVQIEVALAALTKAGGGLIARWAAGSLFTEATRMVGEEEGSRNIDESLVALRNRMLPGTSIVLEGSPWAPWGPIYNLDREHFGRPSEEILVIRAPGPLLWPERYTPAYCEKIRRIDKRAYQADVLGLYVDPEDSFFATEDILACTESGVTSRPPRLDERGQLAVDYVAAMDPATRGNAWTLVVLGTVADGRAGEEYEQVVAAQWRGSPQKPLDPWEVLSEIRDLCAPYGVSDAVTDQASFDALASIGDRVGFGLTGLFGSEDARDKDCAELHAAITQRRIRLLDNAQQRVDIQRVTKRVTASDFVYQYPTSGDGSHCDYVPSLGRAIRYAPAPPGTQRRASASGSRGGMAGWARALVR